MGRGNHPGGSVPGAHCPVDSDTTTPRERMRLPPKGDVGVQLEQFAGAAARYHRGTMKERVTPDGRYFVVRGRLWRRANPALPAEQRELLVRELMNARRAVKAATRTGVAGELALARKAVDQAKIGLGERGPVWWSDGAPDLNRHKVKDTPYAEWYREAVAPAE
jgi:hypothetical protein